MNTEVQAVYYKSTIRKEQNENILTKLKRKFFKSEISRSRDIMGAIQSRSFDFYCDYAIYHSNIESIETDSPSRVYHKMMEENFTCKKQMEAVSIIIYEKAILKTHLSLKCAQLVKELEVEGCEDKDTDTILFHIVFAEYLIKTIKAYVACYDDNTMRNCAVQRGKSIAFFIGNLYIADVFNLTPIIEICHMVKQKETPKNKFFIRTILGVISEKMESENISLDIFNQLIINGLTVVSSDSDSDAENDAMIMFSHYLDRICNDEHYEFYENFRDFRNMSKTALEVEIKILFKDAVEIRNQKFTNVYRDLALEIHYMRPSDTRNCLNSLFIKKIVSFKVINNLDSEENFSNCNALGKTVTEFFNSGLIDEQVVEYFLNVVKSPRVPSLIFTYAFIDVLKKYRGKSLYNYLEYFKKSAKKLRKSKNLISAVEEYVVDKDVEVWRNGKKLVLKS